MKKWQRNLVYLCLLCNSTWVVADHLYVDHIVEDETFLDVKSNVESAIIGKGLVMAHQSNVAEMLNRTGKDLGIKEQTYAEGVIIEFCSASFSRDTTTIDPKHILLCPFAIAVYQLSGEKDKVHVSYKKISQASHEKSIEPQNPLKRVDNLIAEIVEEALF